VNIGKLFRKTVEELRASKERCFEKSLGCVEKIEGQCLLKVVEKGSPEVGANVGDLFSSAMN
jgi:hypothetical protein